MPSESNDGASRAGEQNGSATSTSNEPPSKAAPAEALRTLLLLQSKTLATLAKSITLREAREPDDAVAIHQRITQVAEMQNVSLNMLADAVVDLMHVTY